MPNPRLSLLDEVKEDARFGDIIVTNHAREQMQGRNASAEDVKRAILSATSATLDQKKKTIELSGGVDIDGDPLVVVVALDRRGLRLVTVMGPRARRGRT